MAPMRSSELSQGTHRTRPLGSQKERSDGRPDICLSDVPMWPCVVPVVWGGEVRVLAINRDLSPVEASALNRYPSGIWGAWDWALLDTVAFILARDAHRSTLLSLLEARAAQLEAQAPAVQGWQQRLLGAHQGQRIQGDPLSPIGALRRVERVPAVRILR